MYEKSKIGLFWNVYDNYEDLLLGSEILKHFENTHEYFGQIMLWAGGGYHLPPNETQAQFLDEYFNIEIDPSIDLQDVHIKYMSCYRVLAGLIKALEQGQENELDFVIVTNSDGWLLDAEKLEVLLKSKNVSEHMISIRSAPGHGLWLDNFSYSPYIDDHFMIFNLNKMKSHHINMLKDLSVTKPIFLFDGGIHYFLLHMFEKTFKGGEVSVYCDGSTCINHYGEFCGGSLLPLNYQIDTAFLHANCAQLESLHPIRARFLVFHKLNMLAYCGAYCEKHITSNQLCISKLSQVFKKKTIYDRIFVLIYGTHALLNYVKLYINFRKTSHHRKDDAGFNIFRNNIFKLPVYFISRK